MCKNVEHKYLPGFIVHPSDHPVLIVRNIENRPASHDVHAAERRPKFREIIPNTGFHGVVQKYKVKAQAPK